MQHIFYISASGFLHLCFFVWLSFWICLFRSFWCSLMCTYFWEFGSAILHIFVWILLIPFLSFSPFISEPIFISFRLSVWLSFIFISLSIFSTYKRRFFSWAHLHTKTKETVLFFEESFRDDFLTIFCSTCCRDFKQSRWTNERIQTVKFMLTNRLRTYSTYNWGNTLCIRQAYSRYQVKDCPRCKFF